MPVHPQSQLAAVTVSPLSFYSQDILGSSLLRPRIPSFLPLSTIPQPPEANPKSPSGSTARHHGCTTPTLTLNFVNTASSAYSLPFYFTHNPSLEHRFNLS